MKFIIGFLLFLFAIDSHLCAGITDPKIPDQKYLEYAKGFNCVGRIYGQYKNGDMFSASAVAIDDHNILTAAHVVENIEICFVSFAEKSYEISEIHINVDFNDKKFASSDIAIGYSKEAFNLEHYPQLYTNSEEIGKVCSICGFGLSGKFNNKERFFDNKKRAGSNTIDYIVEESLLICTPSKISDKDRTSLEFLIFSGDSGGGLFIDGKLAGINSCVLATDKTPDGSYNDEAGHTRISKFIDWINDHKK